MSNKLLKVTNDYVFRRIFGSVGNEDITGDLLEKILNKKYTKIDLSKNPILLPDTIENKGGVLDVIINAEEKENINIEMQVLEYEYMAERILEYWAKKYSEEFKRGNDYSVAKRTICILITCFDMKQIKQVDKIHSKWNIREEEYTKIILTDKLEFHIINLEKLEKRCEKDQEKELINWCKFIASPQTLEEKVMKENKSIEKAKEILERISQDEDERELAYRRERAIRDQNAVRAFGYNRGREEGREQGIKEGRKEGRKEGIKEGKIEGIKEEKIEIAKKMLKRKMNIEEIQDITGLKRVEIENLNIQ